MALRNTSLYLRIGEAKNLLAKDLSGKSDPYCVVKVDNDVIARTATVYKSLNPFWGEEYIMHMPCGFHGMSIYVYDEDRVSEDDVIGRVVVSREDLLDNPKGLETWLPLAKWDKDSEVQGDVLLEIKREFSRDKGVYHLCIGLIEARDLAVKDKSGSSDPYAIVSFCDETKQTSTVKKTRFPRWNETFELDIPEPCPENGVINITLWDWDRVGDDDFMGEVEIKLNDLADGSCVKKWYQLWPRSNKEEKNNSSRVDRGSLRLKMRLMEERVLPSSYYKPLINLLLESVKQAQNDKDAGPTPLTMLEEVMTLDLLEIASTLVKLYLGQGSVVAYLDVICSEEIFNTSEPNTLFRGNSLATKSIDQFMKIAGMPYLHETLGPVIDEVYNVKKVMELDPSRIGSLKKRHKSISKDKEEQILEHSKEVLIGYMSSILKNIVSSANRCPPVMRVVFRNLRKRVSQKWPGSENQDHSYLVISGFLFLRFFAAAIMSPKLFGLQNFHPDEKVARTLTLLAKITQSIGNLALQLGKEAWLEPLHQFILNNVADLKTYIDKVVDIEDTSDVEEMGANRRPFHQNQIIKQGMLNKCRLRGSKFLRSFTFKQRHFRLSYNGVTYAKDATDQVRTTIMANMICAVEKVDENAFGKTNMGQILSRNSSGELDILYFHGKNVNEVSSWISSIRKVCIANEKKLDMFHPGSYRGHKWTCCHRSDHTAHGCSKTYTKVTLGDWRDPLDPDIEAQTIYSQLYQGRDILRCKYMETESSVVQSLSQNETGETGSITSISNSVALGDEQMASVAHILDVISDLEKAHQAFEKREKECNS
ncbi:rasGAP-activating-like protein 1 [Liolophura sinensis]|uniref:rasGAP-activating-like protein 1 n=1 Tax=Liolophura sinensis TaxID=3198878 RepID=UPI0031580BF6